MKTTRKQKKREINNTKHAMVVLQQNYFKVVEDYFTYAPIINSLIVTEEKFNDVKYSEIARWFLTQALVYTNIFMVRDKNNKSIIAMDKEEFVKLMTSSKIIDMVQYSDTFKKEDAIEFVNKMIEKFFDQKIFPVIDTKSIG